MSIEHRIACRHLERQAAASDSYASYMYWAEEMFLKEALKQIKKIAGGHAEKVEVVRSGGRQPFLTYEGQDKSDMDMEFTCSTFMSSDTEATLIWFGETVMGGRFDDKLKRKIGAFTPSTIASIFKNVFGH